MAAATARSAIAAMRDRWNKWLGPDSRYRRHLRKAALECVDHGWPVVPGSWWSASAGRHVCDIPGCLAAGLHPAASEVGPVSPLSPLANLADYALSTRQLVTERWAKNAYTVLLATGASVNVIELPAALVQGDAASELWRIPGPIASLNGTVYLFTSDISDDLAEPFAANDLAQAGVVLHRAGSWVPIPPSVTSGHPTVWLCRPQEVQWRLPDPTTLLVVIHRIVN